MNTMKSYFIRHTNVLAIPKKDVERLYEQHKIFIHFPNLPSNKSKAEDTDSLDPKDYIYPHDRRAIERFIKLADGGGYVWAQYYTSKNILVGIVRPQKPKIESGFKWEHPQNRKGMPAKLKTLQLESVKEIKPDEAVSLNVARPRGTISPWHCIENRLACLIEGKALPMEWSSLGSAQQEVACVEYLRRHSRKDIPILKYLLLPPGRTMEGLDIYGVAEDGKKLFVQVTHKSKEESIKSKKTDCFKDFRKDSEHCLFFCDCKEIVRENDITFVPYQLIETWLDQDKPYFKRLIE